MTVVRELDQWLELQSTPPDARYFAQLAVEELGTNIIKYGYDDHNEHLIQIRVSSDEHALQIDLEDDGHEFDPWSRADPDPNLGLEARPPGGWGISLVRRMAAGAGYRRVNGRNLVSVFFSRSPSFSH